MEGLHLDDGTKKIFLNMSSKNGRMELISLLQYMKDTRLDNPEIPLRNKRLERLDRIVGEVKESQEWETVKMDILDYGIQKGMERGKKQGEALKLVKNVEAAMRNFNISLAQACKGLDTTVKEYNKALRLIKK